MVSMSIMEGDEMNREIKFRGWSKIANKICTVKALLSDSVLLETTDGYSGSNNLNDVELMQYTGLKDKRGVEIYEDDIVSTTYDDQPGNWLVEYDAGNVAYMFTRSTRPDAESWRQVPTEVGVLTKHNGMNPDLEVIGNIYENPELLERQKQ